MKVNDLCVLKKQVRPGIYKALCDGYIKVRAGVYRVPIGTIIVPGKDEVIISTKWGRICWHYDMYRNIWFGQLVSKEFAIKMDNTYRKQSDVYQLYYITTELTGTIWMFQVQKNTITKWNQRKSFEIVRKMIA